MNMKKTVIALAALLVAAPVFAAWPTVADPTGPNSGTGRIPGTNEPASGAGYTLAAFPTVADPMGPNSGAGRVPETNEPASGAGRVPGSIEPASGAGRSLA